LVDYDIDPDDLSNASSSEYEDGEESEESGRVVVTTAMRFRTRAKATVGNFEFSNLINIFRRWKQFKPKV
jgi:hypothetical protein